MFGRRDQAPTSLSVGELDGHNGFCINGDNIEQLGTSVAAGYVNEDRISDLIIGAPNAVNSMGIPAGKAYVFFGQANGFQPQYNISALEPQAGFILEGDEANEKTGAAVASVGDFNVDGLNDILIGAPQALINGQPYVGKAYLFFGQRYYSAIIALSQLDGRTGFAIEAENFGDALGTAVSAAGDVNRDGAPDILLGAPQTQSANTGYAALVYGGVSLFSNSQKAGPLDTAAASNEVEPIYPAQANFG